MFPGLPWVIFAVAWFVEGYLLVHEKSTLGKLGLILILVGGGMNLGERMRSGAVLDNLSLLGIIYNNAADYLIVIGVMIYLFAFIGSKYRTNKN